MDPNATLETMMSLALEILDQDLSTEDKAEWGEELAEAVANLHKWIRNGGSLPKLWEPKA
jgi:hypothetical protein